MLALSTKIYKADFLKGHVVTINQKARKFKTVAKVNKQIPKNTECKVTYLFAYLCHMTRNLPLLRLVCSPFLCTKNNR